jgi:hypothetical protein
MRCPTCGQEPPTFVPCESGPVPAAANPPLMAYWPEVTNAGAQQPVVVIEKPGALAAAGGGLVMQQHIIGP